MCKQHASNKWVNISIGTLKVHCWRVIDDRLAIPGGHTPHSYATTAKGRAC